jgi:serine/threonine protein kinase
MQISGFTMLEPVAEGGMASVYLAMQDSLQRKVALKFLKNVESDSQSQRFLSEGKIIASLDHPNIITIYDIGVYDGWRYISMAYHDGGDLEARIAQGIEPLRAVDIIETLARSLDYVHGKGIIHRDVKPANVLFSSDDSPVLTDFGVAKAQQQDLGLTTEGIALGSPYYLSPEQAQGGPIDGRSDIYGLGIVFYEMLTGAKPFQGDNVMDTLIAHLREPIPQLPPALTRYQAVIERMLAKRPEDRYDCAAQLIVHLQALSDVDNQGTVLAAPRRAMSNAKSLLAGWSSPAWVVDGWLGLGQRMRLLAVSMLALAGLAITLAWSGTSDTVSVSPVDHAAGLSRSGAKPVSSRQPVASLASAKGPLLHSVAALPVPARSALAEQQEAASRLLAQAVSARAEKRLVVPENDSAYYYYQQILALFPDHQEAQSGLDELVDTYAQWALREIESLHYKRARQFIARGLLIDPDDERLIALSKQSHTVKHAPKQVARNVRKFFKKTF